MRHILDLKKTAFAFLLVLLAVNVTEGEGRIKYVPGKESFVIVKGTSSLHDWSVQCDQIDGNAEFRPVLEGISFSDVLAPSSDDEKPVVHVSISAISLKSEKKAMDKNMYSALKSEQYPEITYDLSGITVTEIKDPVHLMILAKGLLNIAGVSRAFELPIMVDGSIQNKMIFTGVTHLKMTDFQIKPPKAMLGMLKTGDEVEIQFKWVVSSALSAEEVH